MSRIFVALLLTRRSPQLPGLDMRQQRLMVDNIGVMVAAVIASVTVMMFAAKTIGEFVDRHPSIKVLALAFLTMVGTLPIAEAFDVHVPKAYLYTAMLFSLGVESLNIRARSKQLAAERRSTAPCRVRVRLWLNPSCIEGTERLQSCL